MEPLILDAWTPLGFKRALGDLRRGGRSWAAPTWADEHRRRLHAYIVLRAYIDNTAREFLGDTSDEEQREQHREYGDANLLVVSAVAAVMGESQEIFTEGADDEAESEDDGPTPAIDLQEWLRDWAVRERLIMKMMESERNSVGLGDGVYTLGWDPKKGRPRLRVFDPGFYFPVLDDGNDDEFPGTIHIAYELDDPEDDGKKLLRRITWRLVDLPEGERRSVPWSDEPVTQTCLLSDGTWKLDAGYGTRWDDLVPSKGDYTVEDLDLQIDFIPVVHVPNTVALQDHYGQSVISKVLQILDDLANADTDIQAASATTGTPPLALSGASLGQDRPSYRPGEIIETGDGNLAAIDTSRSLVALADYIRDLLGRLSVNARLPASVLGRVEPSEVPSGIALLLSFGPLVGMVSEMRLVRDEKYQLLLKFAWRLAMAGQVPDVPKEWFASRVVFGPYLPEDRAAVVNEVEKLLRAKAISAETGVRMLVSAGLPIEDAQAEVKRIQAADFEGANRLLDATGNEGVVYEYLDLADRQTVRPPPPELEVDLPGDTTTT